MDYTSADAFRASAAAMMDHCAALGLNTVIVQVRPFGDALYPSALFPWSHLCTGVQGQDPGFDPLDTLIAEAHSRGLSLEGWINPYRLRGSASQPAQLCPASLASTHPEWVVTVADGVYLNPAIPEAAAYVVDGVAELVSRYAVDGVHFDDYFYPTTDPSIDAAQFAASGAQDLDAWRRQNVTALVKAAHDAVKAQDPTLRFGVSPQGNPDNDVHQQYSDVYGWLAAEGEDAVVDYLCPQLYWGVWVYPVRRLGALCLSQYPGRVAGHAPGLCGPLHRAGRLPDRRRGRRRQPRQHGPMVHRAGSGPAGG